MGRHEVVQHEFGIVPLHDDVDGARRGPISRFEYARRDDALGNGLRFGGRLSSRGRPSSRHHG